MDLDQELGSFNSRKRTLKPIETKRSTKTEGKGEVEIMMGHSEEEEPASPGAHLFRAANFDCCIVASIGFKTKLDVDVFTVQLENTLMKHPRFSSILEVNDKKGGEMKWIPTKVDSKNHVIVPNLDQNMDSPDQFVEDYISGLTKIPMNLSKPLWEVHLLNLKTSNANSIGVFWIHHAVGDGASLISLLLACSRRTSNPEELPIFPTKKKRTTSSSSNRNWWFLFAIWSALRLIWNTFVDLTLCLATLLFLKDTKTPIKGAPGVELTPKRLVHFMVSLDDVKLVKNAMNLTINDVLLGVTQAGLSRYLNRRYCEDANENGATEKKNNLPKRIRLRASMIFNIRPSAGIEALATMMEEKSKVKWGNKIGIVLLPFKIALRDDPLDYILQTKAIIDRKKHSFQAVCTFFVAVLVFKIFGDKAAIAIARRLAFNATICFSNVVGPSEEINFCGHPVAYIAPTVYGLPHALTIHFQSYVNKLSIVMAADQDAIPDPHQLCNDLGESLKLIKNAVVQRGIINNGAYCKCP